MYQAFLRFAAFFFALLLFLINSSATAEEVTEYRTVQPKGLLGSLSSLSRDFAQRSFRQAKTITINTPQGPIPVELIPHDIRAKNYKAYASSSTGRREVEVSVHLLRGNLPEGSAKGFVRLALITKDDGSTYLSGILAQDGKYFKASSDEGEVSDEFVLNRLSAAELSQINRACGGMLESDDLHLNDSSAFDEEGGGMAMGAGVNTIQVGTEVDYEFFLANGSSVSVANAEVISILSAVDAIYEAELGISVEVALQNVWTTSADPYTIASGGDGVALLTEFKNYWNNNFSSQNYDVAHFWTTRIFKQNGNTLIGLAFTGTACDTVAPVEKYSMSRWDNSNIDPVTVAHEIGHNLNSAHDNEAYGYSCSGSERFIMCSSISSNLDEFSAISGSVIGNYVASVSCLSDGGGSENRAPILVPPGSKQATEGQVFTLQLQGSDPDFDPLTYSAPNGLPAGAVLDPSSGLFSWKPASGQAGSFNIDLKVSDPLGLSDEETLFLTVNASGGSSGNPTRHTRGDLDGDGKAEPIVYRGSVGMWYSGTFSGSDLTAIQLGLPGDVPVVMDYDGDKRSDRVVFRPSNSTWYIKGSNSGAMATIPFGLTGDIPTAGDFDGDGRDDIAIYRPAFRFFVYRKSSDGVTDVVATLGSQGDLPVVCDFDGDNKTDPATWSPATGVWTILFSQTSTEQQFQWGLPTDFPVPADFDGDGDCERAVWRASTGEWYVEGQSPVQFGLGGDVPIPFDFNGDGSDDLAVWRPNLGIWFRRNGSGQAEIRQLGLYYDTVAGAAALYNGIRNADGDGTTSDYHGKTSRLDAYSVTQGILYAVSPENEFQYTLNAPAGSYILRGDYNGDGNSDIAVYVGGVWTIRFLNSGGGLLSTTTRAWGVATDIPVSADFDGDKQSDIAIYRPLGDVGYSQWYVIASRDNTVRIYNWGLPGDVPVAADFNGDGVDDPTVWRSLNGVWYSLDGRSGMPLINVQWGLPGDQPLMADVDRDGRADRIVFRSSDGQWYTFFSGSGVNIRAHNVSGATPTATLFGDVDGIEFLLYRKSNPVIFRLNATTGQSSSTDPSPPVPNSGTVLSRNPYLPVS